MRRNTVVANASTSPRGWLFDLDGTLVDTAPDLVGTLNDMRRARQLDPLPLAALRCEASNGARGLLGAGLDLHPEQQEFQAARGEFLQRYRARLSQESHLFAGVTELLEALERAHRPWGIVTNKPVQLARELIADLGLQPAVLLGGDSAARAKPSPDSLWLAAAHLGIPAQQCLYLGDAPRDIEAGQAAGMRTVACAWGYIPAAPPITQWSADHCFEQPAHLLELLQ